MHLKARSVNQTWANECDKYLFITKHGKNSSIIELSYPLPIVQPQTTFKSSSTDDMFWTYKYISQNYPNFDWYLKTDDHVFFFVQNLRVHLLSKSSTDLINCARDWNDLIKNGYNARRSASFIFSKMAINRLGNILSTDSERCQITGKEYIDTSNCLKKLNILSNPTHDLRQRELFFENNFIEEYQLRVSFKLKLY